VARRKKRPAWFSLAVLALLLCALAAAWRLTPLRDLLTPSHISGWARAVRSTPWAPWLLVAAYTPAAFLLFPRPLLTLISIIAFGTWLGFAYATAGVVLAAMATYYLGRFLQEDRVRSLAGDQLDRVGRVLRRHTVTSVFALNMVPVPPFVVQGIIAGATRVKAWQYALGTLLGLLPGLLAWTVFGHQINAALEDASVSFWAIGAALLGLGLVVFFGRRWYARQ
jgi:uncharacterized membrane protein YdjX (TVP38/TMEM64 family)